MAKRASYGLDAPGVVLNLALLGAALLALGLGLQGMTHGLATAFRWMGGVFAIEAALMIWTSQVGKRIARDKLLDRHGWRGDEQVLDLGCGRGLLLIGAAKRVPRGRALGVDIWQASDLSGNARAATLGNADREGVRDRVEVVNADIRSLPFEDASFDVVVSSLVIHNLPSEQDRAKALHEALRVLRPGGALLIQDFRHTDAYLRSLRTMGMTGVERRGPSPWMFPFTWRVTGRKP